MNIMKSLSQNRSSLGSDMNLGLLEYEAGMSSGYWTTTFSIWIE